MKHKPLGVIIQGKSFKNVEKKERKRKRKKKGLFDAEEETDGPVL
jgi:hypothetical protein